MILVADSGSTKTDWRLIRSDKTISEIQTIGFNPFYQTSESITEELKHKLLPQTGADVQFVYFYGAGCANEEKNNIVKEGIAQVYPKANIQINNDLLGAARSTCGQNPGIACILGTGSNSCLFDGQNIIDNVSPLGFILGDEGSGAVLGKKFLGNLLKRCVPEHIETKFYQKYKTDRFEILENVYKKPFPNRYLATFSVFMAENLQEPYLQSFLYACFEEFITRNVMKYAGYQNQTIHFAGSVAYHYSEIINKVLIDNNLKIGKIIKSPIELLVEYHLRTNN
jgi:glucosamine kinase